jgi:hypothetical protein
LGAQAAYFKKELNLTADQETKLITIYQDFRQKHRTSAQIPALTRAKKKRK